ncbi:MAG: catalase, partial [Muribaculaceae bacterium]|nr:catalase [Muribaculaceae bacterium]
FGEWKDTPELKEPPMEVQGEVYTYDEREYDDAHYTQPGKLWRLMSDDDKLATCRNTAAQMKEVPLFIRQRHVRACHNADREYGTMLAQALDIDLEEALTAEDPAHPSWDKRPAGKRQHTT